MEWLHSYITEKGYTDVVIVGHSLGGGIVLLYGLKHPENVKGLITAGGGGRLRVHPMFLDGLENAIADPENSASPIENDWPLIDEDLRAVMKRRTEENGLPVMLSDLQACDQFDIMDRLGEIELPLLAVCGTEDVMTPAKYSKYMVDNMKNARTEIIQDGTHFAYAEKPAEVNRAIEAFLKEI